jgi:Transglycosylase-like domain
MPVSQFETCAPALRRSRARRAEAGGRRRRSGPPALALALALALPVAVLVAIVSPVRAGSPAGAAPAQLSAGAATGAGSPGISALQARAAQIAATIGSDAVQIHQLAKAYLAQKTSLAAIEARQAGAQAQADVARAQLAAARSTLAQAAISEYVNSGSGAGGASFLMSDAAGTSAASEGLAYLAVVAGRVQVDEAALEAAAARLASVLTALAGAGRATVIALTATADARQRVLGDISVEETVLTSVQGQMAQLVAEAEVAQAAAQAAALARQQAAEQAAQAAAAAAVARRNAHRAAPPAAPPQGLPLPGGPASVGTGFAIPDPSLAADFAALRMCESSDDYAADTGNGYYGAYQFALSTWEGLGFSGLPSAAPPSVQNRAAYDLWRQDGWAPWPACSAMLGL